MRIKLIVLLLFVQVTAIYSQNCDCEKEFEWVVNTFKDNDAGYEYIVDKRGIDDYNRFEEKQREKSVGVTDINQCKKILGDWLKYFRHGHLFINTFSDNDWSYFSYFMPEGYKPVRLKNQDNQAPESTYRAKPENPYIKELSDQTLYLYISSLEVDYKILIDSVLQANKNLLKQTPNLIIDIRDSRGGSDDSFSGIIPYMYTSPIRYVGTEIRATEMNALGYENYIKMFEKVDNQKQIEKCKRVINQINTNFGNFFVPEGDDVIQIDSSYVRLPFPEKIGVICDKSNGSSDEEFLLTAKQSSKVKIFGRTTSGKLDISNMNFAFSPSGVFWLGYGMTKSFRIPDFCIDDIGLQPDYLIDRTVSDWIRFTQEVLEQ